MAYRKALISLALIGLAKFGFATAIPCPTGPDGEQAVAIFNPFTGRLDCITGTSSNTIVAGQSITVTFSTTTGVYTISSTAGGGGSSSLATALGGKTNWSTQIASPTAAVVMDSNTFTGQLTGGATAFFGLNSSSVTLLGNFGSTASGVIHGIGGNSMNISQVSLSTDVTNTLPPSNLVSTVAYINNSQTYSGANTFTGTNTWTNQQSWTSISPSTFTYGIQIGSVTGSGLSTCGDSTHALNYSASTNLFGCQNVTGSGGGGSSTLAVTTGTANGFTNTISSPTAVIVFDSNTTNGKLTGGSTYFFSLNTASVTLQGNAFNGTNQLVQTNGAGLILDSLNDTTSYLLTQSSASANFLTQSSATVTYYQKLSSVTVAGQLLAGNNITLTQGANNTTIASGGGGIGAYLTVTTGSLSGFSAIISSPTGVINFSSATFNAQLTSASTAFITLLTSSVTLQSNSFNGNSQLLQLTSSGKVPNANIDVTSVTTQGAIIAGNNISVTNNSNSVTISAPNVPQFLGVTTGTALGFTNVISSPTNTLVFDSNTITGKLTGGATFFMGLLTSSVTLQGNGFNGNSQLVQTNASGIVTVVVSSEAQNSVGVNQLSTMAAAGAIEYVISSGTIGTGDAGGVWCEFNGTISSWTISSATSCSIVADVKNAAYSAFPTFTDMVGAGNAPTLSSAYKNTAVPASWTSTTVTQGTFIDFNVTSTSGCSQVTISLRIAKTP